MPSGGKNISSWFRLIRLPNLFMVIITMVLVRYGLVMPLLEHLPGTYRGESVNVPDLKLSLETWQFVLLVLSTTLITAAGYVINDYFDTRTDQINRPHRVIVGREISRRSAMALHLVLNALGIVCGVAVAFFIGFPFLGIVFFMVAGFLWFYSTTYKRQFLIGNLLVALLTGLVPFMVVLFEIPLLNKDYSDIMVRYQATWRPVILWVSAFSLFAFLMTLMRELIKDMEDLEGDWSFGSSSLPVILGMDATRIIVIALAVICAALMGTVWYFYLGDTITLVYIILLLIIPLVWLIIGMIRARKPADYHRASTLSKWIMLAGVVFILVVRYIITKIL